MPWQASAVDAVSPPSDNFVVARVGASPYPDELTAVLESSQIDMVVALIQQAAGESDVIHGQSQQLINLTRCG